jgi:hypothetical protein
MLIVGEDADAEVAVGSGLPNAELELPIWRHR